jgi:hypothetical protein
MFAQMVDTMEAIQKRGLNLFRRESAKGVFQIVSLKQQVLCQRNLRIESGADVLENVYPALSRRKK